MAARKTKQATKPEAVQYEQPATVKVNFLAKTENQRLLSRLIHKKDIVICGGPAGTGKTYVACAESLKLLADNNNFYKKIIIAKSVTVTEGEDVGFLKGTLKDKMEPVMESFLDNFHKIIGKELTNKLMEKEVIQILPLAYIRGRSIDNTIIILDEAQNVSLKNMRTAMTRIGEDSKMVIIGDTKQIDLKNKKLSSLEVVMDLFKEKSRFGVMSFVKEDIVRNSIIIEIEDAFDEYELKISGGSSSAPTTPLHS
jgi:phosphate starvation-inducible PhoH-like protein